MARQLKATEVRVPCRISYAHLIETDKNDNYSVSLLIPKSDKKTLDEINKAVEAAIVDGKSKLANKDGAINKKMLKLPLRDADEEGHTSPDYQGNIFFNAKSKRRPQVVDRHKEMIYDAEEIYSGCYCNVMVNFYAFAVEGNKGIAASLGNVQKVKDGDRLGYGGTTAEADFDNFEDDENDLADLL